MTSLDPSKITEQYGEVWLEIDNPFISYGYDFEYNVDKRQYFKDRRWTIMMDLDFHFGGASSADAAGLARCGACFDVKNEDDDLEEGDNGIGVCFYYDSALNEVYDANFFGTIEATGSDGFKFLDKSENDWDTDSGYLGWTSNYDTGSYNFYFVSEPLNINSNSKKNLGI